MKTGQISDNGQGISVQLSERVFELLRGWGWQVGKCDSFRLGVHLAVAKSK
jgi:hypothetical protein